MTAPAAGIRYITEPSGSKTFRAGWVIKDPWTVLENAGVVVAGGQIKKIVAPAPKDASVQDLGQGVLMAPLVNAHVHLELSALKNRLPLGKGFASWVAALLRERDAAGPRILKKAAEEAVASLPDMGVGLVGEISTLGITSRVLNTSGLAGVWFREFLGDEHAYPGQEEQDPYLKKQFPLSFSAAGHAPHTTAPQLLTSLKKRTRGAGLVFSLHVAESEVEMDFIAGNRGGWTDFLASRGIDTTAWPVGNKTPVAYLHDLGVLDNATLGVHLLQVTDRDLDILARTGTKLCLCPRSNHNLHGRLPDIASLLARNLAPALGTDSLASCDSLGMFDEMAFVRQRYPHISAPDLLAMATINGARALGLGQHGGTLDPGRSARLLYLDITALTPADVIKKVTAYGI
jgi:aminodeoxyfutalosine deaminase